MKRRKLDNNLLADCFKAAMKVDFLTSSGEIKIYAYALYDAYIWSVEVK